MRFLVAGALLAIALAGCSEETGTVPAQDDDGRYVVHLTAENRFEPAHARVPAGATVAWVVDGGAHDVSADDGSFSSAEGRPEDEQGFPTLLQPGETFTHTFPEAGTWTYWCHTHHEMDMQGTITVE